MAQRRMFSKHIIDSDAFLEMPLSTQTLYFHLSMRADDDGFINNPKKIMRMVGCGEDELRILLAKRFVLDFESGVIVIKHWRMHNQIRNDRHNKTVYEEEFSRLQIKENGSYSEKEQKTLENAWQPNGNQMATQSSIGKDSIVKSSQEQPEKKSQSAKADKKNPYSLANTAIANTELDRKYLDPLVFAINMESCKDYAHATNLAKSVNTIVKTYNELNGSMKKINDAIIIYALSWYKRTNGGVPKDTWNHKGWHKDWSDILYNTYPSRYVNVVTGKSEPLDPIENDFVKWSAICVERSK